LSRQVDELVEFANKPHGNPIESKTKIALAAHKKSRLIGNSGDLGQFAGLLVGSPTRQPTNHPCQPPEIRLSQKV
jgi:hypothetical protein